MLVFLVLILTNRGGSSVLKKKKTIATIATMLMAYAAIIPLNNSFMFAGEPQLPRSVRRSIKVTNHT